jgi:hypothetical protein
MWMIATKKEEEEQEDEEVKFNFPVSILFLL